MHGLDSKIHTFHPVDVLDAADSPDNLIHGLGNHLAANHALVQDVMDVLHRL
eukprot:CAMPEP_0175976312 /NCGR_PEP_ID=MMETSP0108-20121206/44448_1 /TAXON_ID=195067 ORGANISM="Goniomonas pacifica, Strain CCMP1869" /NCGR_SAMPLE_ID=MMETSP0108 /ASSEMBLY_ACC=CAM_ASM_000204 /LENGTH=51 /DNA_ID=CAMNT_0017306193 /DNA_START=853 /DNA_END=1004 /DNA_ORIENTATION=-